MKHLCLTDWVTLRGNAASVITITQGEAGWLDVGDYEDAIFYLDVREVTSTVNLYYQTSPSKEDTSFVNLLSAAILLTPTATGTSTHRLLAKYASVPIARYVRWQVAGVSGTYDATLRIHIAVT